MGTTKQEAFDSCTGCPLRDSKKCYAWTGMNAMIFAGQHVKNFAVDPVRFALIAVLNRVSKKIKAARIGVLGDPARVDPGELKAAFSVLRSKGFAVLAYTHFWRERASRWLRPNTMASCDDLKEADEAYAMGFRPAAILPWDHEGNRFETPGGLRGVVCPAQTHDKVTCNSCRMCDPQHSVWSKDTVDAIGFIEHSKKAIKSQEREANDKTLPLFPREPLSGWRGKAGKPPEERKRGASQSEHR